MKQIKQRGQIIIILLLTILVGLGIGLVVTQKSITDVTISTQTEQSSRALSAAQAGLEKLLLTDSVVSIPTLDNQATIQTQIENNLPAPGQALEFPDVSNDKIGYFWLATPGNCPCPPSPHYTNPVYTPTSPQLDVYFGNTNSNENPAIEITIVTDSSGFSATRHYVDTSSSRRLLNGFSPCTQYSSSGISIDTSSGLGRKFTCKFTTPAYSGTPVLVRARILYTTIPQNVAVQPTGSGSLPTPQVKIYTSTGTSGSSQKKLRAYKFLYKSVPLFFDHAIFSAGDITK